MKPPAALLLALLAVEGRAATAYVTDELVLGVYAAQSTEGERLATLHSGARVETLAVRADATQVRLDDGTVGWVKTAYLISTEPAIVRVKQLEEELNRSHAATPELADAAERHEVERLKGELAALSELGAAGANRRAAERPWLWGLAVIVALGCGFWLGYTALARRIKYKFGGIKVY